MSISKPVKIELRDWEKDLYTAFLRCYGSCDISKISLKHLCEEVGINRSTFYRSYYDIYDLKEKIEDYCVNSFRCYYMDLWYSDKSTDSNGKVDFSNLPPYNDVYALSVCIALKDEYSLFDKLFETIYKDALNFYQEKKLQLSTEFEYMLHFCSMGFVLTCAACLNTEQKGIFSQILRVVSYICEEFFYHGKELMSKTSFTNFELPIKEDESKERLNVKKTKRSLKNAYVQLLKETEREKLNVNTLCERAEVSCSTFYTHYKSLEDFEEKLKAKSFRDSLLVCRQIYNECGEISDKVKLGTLVKLLSKDKDMITLLLARKHDLKEVMKFSLSASDAVTPYITEQYESTFDEKVVMNFICNGAMGELFNDKHKFMTDRQVLVACYYIFEMLFTEKKTDE